ncbi:type II toxin-antitoxin system HigA family antitoxin [Providencia rettgeri]
MSAFKPRILKNDNDYNEAMDRISELMEMSPEIDSEEFNELEMISLFIDDYESKHYKVNKPSAIDAIKFRMDQDGLTQKDMEQYLGSRSKVSEVLSGKRNLSQTMIKKLHIGLGIPLDILIQSTDDLQNTDIDEMIKVTTTQEYETKIISWDMQGSAVKLKELVISTSPSCDKSVMQ